MGVLASSFAGDSWTSVPPSFRLATDQTCLRRDMPIDCHHDFRVVFGLELFESIKPGWFTKINPNLPRALDLRDDVGLTGCLAS